MGLRVLAVSVAPLFPDAVHGGSQRILTQVAHALADAGHTVRIACGERDENRGGFELRDRVTVEPVLRLRGFFPDPYEAPPHQIAETVRSLRPLIDWAERIYLHADIFHFRPLLPERVPVVRSFHDFHYETALVSAFGHGADLTIVPSDYLRRCIQATVGRSGLRPLEPIEVIPNGIDLDRYRPMGLGAPEGADRSLVLLHPHRPDPRKGIEQALLVVREVLSRAGGTRVRLLVPRHVDADTDAGAAAYYAGVERLARELGVSDSVEFHAWLGDRDMPALYRSADVTLCLGNFIESFGLTAYESLACGTPVVAAKVGALREAPDLTGLYRVEFGDIASASSAVLEAGREMSAGEQEAAWKGLQDRFGLGAMKDAYARAIEGATPLVTDQRIAGGRRNESRQRNQPERPNEEYELAPWCHVAGDRIYNDYAYRHLDLPRLAQALVRSSVSGRSRLAMGSLNRDGVQEAELHEAVRTGVLIPSDVTVT